jgi:recombination protein RecT
MGVDKILSMVDVLGTEDRLKKYRRAVETVLPKGMESNRYWTMYVQMAQDFINDPKITDKQSVINCMFNAPKLGLIPDPVMGQIYFIPYSGKLTYQIGYKGMIALSYRSGEVINVRSGLVYEKDKWTFYEDELGQHYHFEPNLQLEGKARGKELFGYSIFTDKNGRPNVHIMDSYHIDQIKKIVLARTPKSPWANELYEPEMRKKTIVRRHWKTEPISVEIAKEIEREEMQERGEIKKDDHPELNEIMDGLIEKSKEPSPETVEGKALNNELDLLASKQK